MSKSIIKLTVILLAVVCLTAASAGCAANTESSQASSAQQDVTEGSNNMDYTEYVKDLGIDLTGTVAAEYGEIKGSDDPYAYICFTLGEGKRESAEKILNEACGRMREVNPETIPAYLNHPIAVKMKSETMIGSWKTGISGANGAKSRILTFYLTEQNGVNDLYFFG